tara:strand:+ start:3374 stop:5410 length:2037 start_codon:yes stop_codon:yes gene_type:complete
MPVINFPSNPSNNELFIAEGKAMRYNSAKNKWRQVTTLTQSQVTSLENNTIGVASMSISGNTLVIEKDNGTHANVSLAPFAGNILTNYASASQLPLTNLVSGTQVYVTDTDSLFITDGSGWFKVATVNLSPSLSLGVSSISLSTGGSVDVNYTVNEPEDTPYTISASATSNATVTVHQSNNTITFDTPTASTSETITISATDGVNTVGDTLTMTITLPTWETASQSGITIGAPVGVNSGAHFGGNNQSARGQGVAMSADGNTMVISAYNNQGNNIFEYNWDGSSWILNQNINGAGSYALYYSSTVPADISANGGAPSRPGHAVDIDMAAGVLVVSDPGVISTNGNGNGGVVYVYERQGTSWIFQQMLRPTANYNTNRNMYIAMFGEQVRCSGNTIIVGAWRQGNSSSENIGSVYIYTKSGSTWSLQQEIQGPGPNSYFGANIAYDPTEDRVAISAWGGQAAEVGTVFIYERSGSTWTQADAIYSPGNQNLNGSQTEPRPYTTSNSIRAFGRTVSLDGNWLSIGAYYFDSQNEEKVFVYWKQPGQSWNHYTPITIQPNDVGTYNLFGNQVRIVERTTSSQQTSGPSQGEILIVSAWHHGTQDRGAIYVFKRQQQSPGQAPSTSAWNQIAKYDRVDNFTLFGISDKTGGVIDMNEAGTKLAVSSHHQASGKGEVYVFEGN